MHHLLGFGLLLLSFFQNFSTVPWRSAHSEFFAFLAVTVWAWSAVPSGYQQARRTPPVTALLCVAVVISLQYFSGQIIFGGDAITLLLYIQLCLVALVVGQLYAEDPKWAKALALSLLLAALGSAIIALAQSLWVWTDSGWILSPSGYRRPGANFGQPNQLATLLVMGAASLIYLDQRLKISRLILIFLSVLLVMGLGIAESRTGLLSALGLSFWWFQRRRVMTTKSRWPWIVGVVLASFAFIWSWPHFIGFVHEAGLSAGGAGLNVTAGTRLLVWHQLWDAVWMKPWLGWGLGGTSFALNEVLETYEVSEPFTYAHNIILDLAIGMGPPLTVLALIAVCVWGWGRMRSVRTVDAWYAVALLIPFVIHSLLEYPFAYAYLLVPAMLAVGMLEHNYSSVSARHISRKVVVGNLVIFSVLLILAAVEYIEVEEDFRVARFESLNVGKTAIDYVRPNIVLLTQLSALLEATRTVPHPNMPPEELLLLRSTAARFPWVPVQNCYALSAALNDNQPEAQRQLKVLRAMRGEGAYRDVMKKWKELADSKYPQLNEFIAH